MWELKKAVEEAIAASGKSAAQIARDGGIDENTISRLKTGLKDNPELATLLAFARGAGITPAALLAGPFEISPRDVQELLAFRDWINSKLATIDALKEPNAKMVKPGEVLRDLAADRQQRGAGNLFGRDANLLVEVTGDSMIGDGIIDGDTLYATPIHPKGASPIDRIVACRIGEAEFVKRLRFEDGRRILYSSNPRYRPIVAESIDVLGIVVGRKGAIK
jgi:transcriptional regulator with XRE-family HTH domain